MSSCDISDNFVIDTNGRIDSDKTGTLTSRYGKGVTNFGSDPFILDTKIKIKPDQDKSGTFTDGGNSGGLHSDMDLICVSSNQAHASVSVNKSTPMVAAMGMGGGHVPIINPQNKIRRLTPTECSRLQTIPEWYRWECSDTQAYRMLGNGWTVEVIKHILQWLEF